MPHLYSVLALNRKTVHRVSGFRVGRPRPPRRLTVNLIIITVIDGLVFGSAYRVSHGRRRRLRRRVDIQFPETRPAKRQ